MMKTSILVCLGAAALFACSSDNSADAPASIDAPAGADAPAGDAGTAKVFNLTLAKTGEPSVCAAAPDNATASATITISADNSQVIVSNLTWSNFDDAASGNAASAGHIHYGTSVTPSGPPVLYLFTTATTPPAGGFNKTFTAADYMAGAGAPATFAAFVTAMRSGDNAYLNLHTTACAGGEVRAELQ